MSDYIRYSPWQDAANMGQGLAHNLGALALQVPKTRAEIAEMQARQALYGAQAQTEGAQAQHYNAQVNFLGAQQKNVEAKTAHMNDEAHASGEFGNELGNLFSAMQTPGADVNAAGHNVMVKFGEYAQKHPKDAFEGLGRVLQMINAPKNDPTAQATANLGKPVQKGASVNDTQWAGVNQPPQKLNANQVMVPNSGGAPTAMGNVLLQPGAMMQTPQMSVPQPMADMGGVPTDAVQPQAGRTIINPTIPHTSLGNALPTLLSARESPLSSEEQLVLAKSLFPQLTNAMPSTPKPAKPSGNVPTYASEQEARSKGAKAGSIVRITGVGVVKLK